MNKSKNILCTEMLEQALAEIARLIQDGEMTEVQGDHMRQQMLTAYNRAQVQTRAGSRRRF